MCAACIFVRQSFGVKLDPFYIQDLCRYLARSQTALRVGEVLIMTNGQRFNCTRFASEPFFLNPTNVGFGVFHPCSPVWATFDVNIQDLVYRLALKKLKFYL